MQTRRSTTRIKGSAGIRATGVSVPAKAATGAETTYDRQRKVLELLLRAPMPLDVTQIGAVLGVSKYSARQYVTCLVAEGAVKNLGKGLYTA